MKTGVVTKVHLYPLTPLSSCQRLTMGTETTIYSHCLHKIKCAETFNVEIKQLHRKHEVFSPIKSTLLDFVEFRFSMNVQEMLL